MERNLPLSVCIAHIEEWLNTHTFRDSEGIYSYRPEEWQDNMNEALEKHRKDPTAADYVLKLLPQRGFAYPDGQPYCSKFYKYARIAPDVWSSFLGNKHQSSPQTLLKIALALHMSDIETLEFLSLAGSGFDRKNPVHTIVRACIECGYYEPDLVYSIIEFYRPSYEKNGKSYRNIYDAN